MAMRSIRCAIVDDEPLALDLIEGYVRKTPFLELVARCSSPYQALQTLNSERIDLIYLDIQMPGVTGIEFSRIIQNGPKIIFTTAYSQFALEGFKVDALDYLVKPFNYQEFMKASTKALTWFSLLEKQPREDQQLAPPTPEDRAIFVKADYKLQKVEFDKIVYIEGLKDYVKIFLTDHPKPILTLMSLKSLEEKLPSSQFMRVHRSYIVNLHKVNTIERSRIVFGSTYIPIADGYKEKFQAFLDKRSIG
jgi:DNA-binding LytR/AlgR family response regulator